MNKINNYNSLMLKGSHCYCCNKNHLTDLHHGVAAYIVYIGDMKLTVSRCCDDHPDLMTLHTNQLCFLASNPASLCNCILSGQSLGCCLCTRTVGWLCQLVECNLLLKILLTPCGKVGEEIVTFTMVLRSICGNK